MNTPTGFNVKEISFPDKGGLKVVWTETSSKNSVTNIKEKSVTSPEEVHPDLSSKSDKLIEYIADVFRLIEFKKLFDSSKKKGKTQFTAKEETGFSSLKRIIDSLEDDIISSIKIVKISIAGTGDSRTVKFNAKMINNDNTIVLNTPAIMFSGQKWGWEVDLDQDIDFLIEECEEYLFRDKQAQLSMFGEANGKKQNETVPAEEEF